MSIFNGGDNVVLPLSYRLKGVFKAMRDIISLTIDGII